ncbi:unnamed protein product [Schistosoma curassoni]|uniref:SPARK domain-containing protein n=1 Tax=Schistosoma curassoni TaxID=6186 RepID=A0A183JJD6_9TREM|nr:unnamed protein product [Schistosoma curassoni]
MLHCWNFNPLKRPTFLGLSALLSPCFGDAEFRMASFFYHGEQSFVNKDNRLKVLEAPAVSLGKLNISCNQDPAHALACALSTLFCGTDEDSSYEYNDQNFDPRDNFSAASMQFGAISRTVTVKASPIGSGHFNKTHLVNCSPEDISLKQSDNGIALSEVQCLLRLCEHDPSLAVPPFVDSESFPLISNHIKKFSADECTNFELSKFRNLIT